jgi:hypothetical protein
LELVIDPNRARLRPEQVRRFVTAVMAIYADISQSETEKLTGQADEQ